MLVLSRDRDTAVRIGADVKVKILSIRKNRVKLGIDAPRDVRVWRDEMAPPSEAPNGDLAGSMPKPQPNGNGRFSILIVEDNPDHAQLIGRVLSDCQVGQVAHAATGAEAIERLTTDASAGNGAVQPHLVLLDLHLPDMPGLNVLREVRATPRLRTLPIVILSGDEQESLVADCLESGANAFVYKSGRFNEFRDSVSRVVTFWQHGCRTPRTAGALSL